jgi:hypothetical protein
MMAVCKGCGCRVALERVLVEGRYEWLPPPRWNEEWSCGRRFMCDKCDRIERRGIGSTYKQKKGPGRPQGDGKRDPTFIVS